MPEVTPMSTGRRPLIQRIANRLGTPLGVLPFPFANDFEAGGADVNEGIFEWIYRQNYWTRGESGSGAGSELTWTRTYRQELLAFLRSKQISSMFDAPCGDLNWMRHILAAWPMTYVGGDISQTAIAMAKERCPDADLRLFDIRYDDFPDCEVWHCRDTLFHLSFDDIWLALENAARSNIRYALITTHRARWLRNLDIPTGSWRYLDLQRAPFNLPRPLEYLRDHVAGEFPRFVGVWPIQELRTLERRRANDHSSRKAAPNP
jgi:SAM-dependent methyltransferase